MAHVRAKIKVKVSWFKSKASLIKLLRYILFEKYIYILSLKMVSPGNQHCANCIGILSLPMDHVVVIE